MRKNEAQNDLANFGDLMLTDEKQAALKGGPRLIIKKAPTFHDEPGVDLPDLAPQAEVKGGASHTAGRCSCGQEHPYGVGGFINNHNETVVSDEGAAPMLLTDLEPNFDVVGGSSGGAAGGIVSEGQGYGTFIAQATPSTPSRHPTGMNIGFCDGSVR